MARFTQDIVLNKPDDFVYFIMNDYLQKNEFTMSNWKGEPAYQAGNAMVDGLRFLKWSYANGVLHLEAWLKGSMGGEWNLDGFVGCLMKKPYKESLMQLITVLQQTIPSPQNMQGAPGAEAGADGKQVVHVQTVDNHSAATMGLVLGILSIVFCWLPLIAIILGCIGYSRARLGMCSSKAGAAKAGKVCSMIGIILGIVLWAMNFLLSMAGILLY